MLKGALNVKKKPSRRQTLTIYILLTMFLQGEHETWGNIMDHDQNLLIQAEMLSLLEGITLTLVEKHPLQFLLHLDQIRQKSAQHHLTALHDLSCAFEAALQQALQNGTGVITAQSYLDVMKDALECGPVDAATTETLMANVALRLGGQP